MWSRFCALGARRALSTTVTSAYEAQIKSRGLVDEPTQRKLLVQLDALSTSLCASSSPSPPPRGLYLHGSPGCGKTFLMDLFFNNTNLPPTRKYRTHFHSFMADIHLRLHVHRQSELAKHDPLPLLAQHLIAEKGNLWCFDEFQVTDVADALILHRLLSAFFALGCTFVLTSNRAPDQLYWGGLNRSLFLPCIDLLKQKCTTVKLENIPDFRRQHAISAALYLWPASDATRRAALDNTYALLCRVEGATEERDASVNIASVSSASGRRFLSIPRSCGRIARFTFDELCGQPLGSNDYMSLCSNFHTIVLTDIPHFNADRRNQMRRFITFLDIAYERHVRLLCLAISAPHELFQAGASTAAATATAAAINPIRSADKGASVAPAGGSSGRSTTMIGQTEWSATGLAGASLADIDPTRIEDEMFAFERAVSRLNEMSSTSYVEQWVSLHAKE